MKGKIESRRISLMKAEPLFQVRFNVDSRQLHSSLQMWGLLNPIHLYETRQGTFILDGWSRLEFLKQQAGDPEIMVIVYREEDLSLSEALLLFVELNLVSRAFNLVEKALILKKTQSLFSGSEWPKALFSVLNISPQLTIIRDYRDLLKLPHFILKYIVNNDIPLRIALQFLKFPPEDIEKIAIRLFVYPLNQNKLAEILEILHDLSRAENCSASDILQDVLQQMAETGLMQQKEKTLRESLRKRKNPRFEQQMHHFLQKAGNIPLNTQTSVVPAPFFEEDYVEIKSRIYSQTDIEHLIHALKHHAWQDLLKT